MSTLSENYQSRQETYEEENTTKDMYLVFEIDNEDYAIDVINIKEIKPIPTLGITNLPQTPDYIKGIINLRGDIVPVIDIRTRFLKPEMEYNELTCILVIDYDEEQIIGLIVDQVKGVPKIYEENISPIPAANLSYTNQYIKNIARTENGVILLLDLERLLF